MFSPIDRYRELKSKEYLSFNGRKRLQKNRTVLETSSEPNQHWIDGNQSLLLPVQLQPIQGNLKFFCLVATNIGEIFDSDLTRRLFVHYITIKLIKITSNIMSY